MPPQHEHEQRDYEQRDYEIVQSQLGRDPVGFREVVRRTAENAPAVIRVASVVDGVPFPTLYWVSDPYLTDLIYRYESDGATRVLQEQIDSNEINIRRLMEDNRAYVRHRESFFDESTRHQLRELGIDESFAKKGIGGVANWTRVRCLHAYLGAHVVVPNLVGELLTIQYGPEDPLVIALSRLN